VDLPQEADMDSIISQLNGKVLDGRPLKVNEARHQQPREFGGSGGFNRSRNKFGGHGGSRGGGRGEGRQRNGGDV